MTCRDLRIFWECPVPQSITRNAISFSHEHFYLRTVNTENYYLGSGSVFISTATSHRQLGGSTRVKNPLCGIRYWISIWKGDHQKSQSCKHPGRRQQYISALLTKTPPWCWVWLKGEDIYTYLPLQLSSSLAVILPTQPPAAVLLAPFPLTNSSDSAGPQA